MEIVRRDKLYRNFRLHKKKDEIREELQGNDQQTQNDQDKDDDNANDSIQTVLSANTGRNKLNAKLKRSIGKSKKSSDRRNSG